MILVDVGVWLAATWGRHAHHRVARQWFDEESDDLILCRVTQMSLLRLITNSAILGEDAVTRSGAWRIVDQIWSDDRVLWAEEPDQLKAVFRAISARDDNSHKLWTDDYLAAFAQAIGASLVTLDTKLEAVVLDAHAHRRDAIAGHSDLPGRPQSARPPPHHPNRHAGPGPGPGSRRTATRPAGRNTPDSAASW